jgi:hypothetical protein
LLSQELQIPLVNCIFNQMQSMSMLPTDANIGENIEPTIITGLDALGRGADLQKLVEVTQLIVQFPEGQQVLNYSGLFTRIFAAAGIDANGIIKTPEEAQADINQAQMDQQAIEGANEVAVNQATQQ